MFGLLMDFPEDLRPHMMDAAERALYDEFPEEVVIYRGCYALNKWGLSWTTDRAIAERFPTLHRYRQDGQPLLVTARVRKVAFRTCQGGRGGEEDNGICRVECKNLYLRLVVG